MRLEKGSLFEIDKFLRVSLQFLNFSKTLKEKMMDDEEKRVARRRREKPKMIV